MVVNLQAVYSQCTPATVRLKLWEKADERQDLPSPGEILHI
jgi:hypothetical protein